MLWVPVCRLCVFVSIHSPWFSPDSAVGGDADSLTEKSTCSTAALLHKNSTRHTHIHNQWHGKGSELMWGVHGGRPLSLYLVWKVHLVWKLLQWEKETRGKQTGSFTGIHGSALRTDGQPQSSQTTTGNADSDSNGSPITVCKRQWSRCSNLSWMEGFPALTLLTTHDRHTA